MALSKGRQWIAVHGLRSGRAGAGGGFGPNLVPAPPYGTNWTLNNLVETTGQTDPLGGTGASLLTDNAVNGAHSISTPTSTFVLGAKYLYTMYFKPGTYPNGITIISKISRPTLTIFLPEKNSANGTAVVICRGGGYGVNAASHERTDVAQEFIKMDVAEVVLN